MSDIRPTINNSAIPLFCNTAQNRLRINLSAASDVSSCQIFLYEHDGVYWFCLRRGVDINSIGFVGLRNCASSLRTTLDVLGFSLGDPDSLKDFVRRWEHSLKSSSLRKGVA